MKFKVQILAERLVKGTNLPFYVDVRDTPEPILPLELGIFRFQYL